MNEIKIPIKEMMPLIRESIERMGNVKIIVTGISMQPMVYDKRDSVNLVKAPEKLKKYDIPLYVREDGSVILHRVIKVNKDGSYVCRGDNQFISEYGIENKQIVGIISKFSRNGKSIDINKSFKYKIYVYTWPFFHHFKFLYKYIVLPFKK